MPFGGDAPSKSMLIPPCEGGSGRLYRPSAATNLPRVILLTGATGNVGSQVLRRLTARGERVRVLVRDPRRLGNERVRVQIALGDLSDPASFRNALRGVETVVHLAAAIRDQPRASIEELNGVATLRPVRAADRARTGPVAFLSAIRRVRRAGGAAGPGRCRVSPDARGEPPLARALLPLEGACGARRRGIGP